MFVGSVIELKDPRLLIEESKIEGNRVRKLFSLNILLGEPGMLYLPTKEAIYWEVKESSNLAKEYLRVVTGIVMANVNDLDNLEGR